MLVTCVVVKDTARILANVPQAGGIRTEGCGKLLQFVRKDEVEELALVPEVVVEPFFIQSGKGSDPRHGGAIEAMCGELNQCCFPQASPRFFCIPGHSLMIDESPTLGLASLAYLQP